MDGHIVDYILSIVPFIKILQPKIYNEDGDRFFPPKSSKKVDGDPSVRTIPWVMASSLILEDPISTLNKDIIEADVSSPKFLVEFKLTLMQRLFFTFHHEWATENILGNVLNFVFMLAAAACTLGLMISTLDTVTIQPSTCEFPVCFNTTLCPNRMVCEPVPPPELEKLQHICSVIFSIDYFVRIFFILAIPQSLLPLISPLIPLFYCKKSEAKPGEDENDGVHYAANADGINIFRIWFTYVFSPLNLIDALAILPFYAALLGGNIWPDSLVRLLRISRAFRVFKIAKGNKSVELLYLTLAKSSPALSLMFFFMGIGVVIFGTSMYFIEQGNFQVTPQFPDG